MPNTESSGGWFQENYAFVVSAKVCKNAAVYKKLQNYLLSNQGMSCRNLGIHLWNGHFNSVFSRYIN